MDRIFDLLDTPLGNRIMRAVFFIVPVLALIAGAVFFVQHKDDECPPNTPKLALAHQTCINRQAEDDALILP